MSPNRLIYYLCRAIQRKWTQLKNIGFLSFKIKNSCLPFWGFYNHEWRHYSRLTAVWLSRLDEVEFYWGFTDLFHTIHIQNTVEKYLIVKILKYKNYIKNLTKHTLFFLLGEKSQNISQMTNVVPLLLLFFNEADHPPAPVRNIVLLKVCRQNGCDAGGAVDSPRNEDLV